MLKKIILAASILSLIGSFPVFAQEKPIGFLFKDKSPIKVYIKEVINASGEDQISPEFFKESLQQSLLDRKLVKFEIADDPDGSDIQASVIIKKYRYLKRGPVKPIPGVSIVLDVAASLTANYVEMSVEYTVTDTKTNEILWSRTVNENLKKVMTPEESIPLICKKISRTFVWKCFGRKQDLEGGS
ncbi:MAG: hypothetical protein M0R66_05270 [Candidatus Omnitrophica bacterium]|nr:hypothetical protein [Candidatus Omnitrophota bacterium]